LSFGFLTSGGHRREELNGSELPDTLEHYYRFGLFAVNIVGTESISGFFFQPESKKVSFGESANIFPEYFCLFGKSSMKWKD